MNRWPTRCQWSLSGAFWTVNASWLCDRFTPTSVRAACSISLKKGTREAPCVRITSVHSIVACRPSVAQPDLLPPGRDVPLQVAADVVFLVDVVVPPRPQLLDGVGVGPALELHPVDGRVD